MIPNQRALFSIPDNITYLNCAYTSPLMKTAEIIGKKAISAKGLPWNITPPDFFKTIETVRGMFAQLIHTSGENIAIIPAVSYGIALAAKNLPVSPGQEIVVLEDQFPSNIYSWKRVANEKKGQIQTVKRPLDYDWTSAVIKTIDTKTAIVAVPNCHWTDGTLLDLIQIGTACRDCGAALVIDGTQSLGAMPFSIEEVRPDFVVTTAHKWLLGPYSLGFCYIAPEWQNGIPLEENWLNRAGSEDFSRLVDYRDEYQPGARRFDVGGASNFFLSPIAEVALKQLLYWNIHNIAETIRVKTDRIAQEAESRGFKVPPKSMRAPHLIGITLPKGIPDNLIKKLSSEQIFVSSRGQSIRIAPHLYNTDKDLTRLFDALG
ncbi:MAG: aminotransferase class V-fold PLP-dependent enzyme [Deltaproteobacteria bacterium]|uniref:aminotransferase class V-fold PLP-dependent enzyme n=1 Tax=Desulfobacula sp. TaxID=2593537 RepID=UPI0019C21250|nr:aminotransferase class V-fold PLP-dependent enzyme [Candidatus Desulfobacula maris]MBL6992547.1 aminotransferase class V-fold PLP-dependent enzyme [Desulfobacula sp.]